MMNRRFGTPQSLRFGQGVRPFFVCAAISGALASCARGQPAAPLTPALSSPSGHQKAAAPNLLYLRNELYTYGSGQKSDPPPTCLDESEMASRDLVPVGVVGPVGGDQSASVASVGATGPGPAVLVPSQFEGPSTTSPRVFLRLRDDCYVLYLIGPG